MINETLKEALEAIENINDEICDFLDENYGESFLVFELRTDGNSVIINFMGSYRLWFSDEDEREFFEEANKYESLEGYLRRESQKIIDQISTMKLYNA